jgi:chitinase
VASARPLADGTLDTAGNGLTDAVAAELVQAAHAARRPVLVSIGGHNSQAAFEGAMSDVNRDAFVQNILSLVAAHGYDGVDLDMEPLGPADDANYANLVHALRARFGAGTRLTAAANSEPVAFAALQPAIDEINLLSYDLSGPYAGWETWFDSPLYTAGHVFKSDGKPLPSCDRLVQSFVTAGVAPSKLNLGVHFYGAIWFGASGPNQSIAGVAFQSASYAQIADQYAATATYHWQADVEAPYLAGHDAASNKDVFVSFDDVTLVQKKVDYVRAGGLGGLSVWELTGGHRPAQPAGRQDDLLDTLKSAIAPL